MTFDKDNLPEEIKQMLEAAREEGYQEGIRNQESKSHDYLIPSSNRTFSAIRCDKFRQRLSEKDIPMPTPAQFDAIFSSDNAVKIIASAGSGKTTTMVLRVLFMVGFLHISANEITVISFTRKSVSDFKQKLLKMAEVLEIDLTEKACDRMVKTFHSKLLKFARYHFSNSTYKSIFEHQGKEKAIDKDDTEPDDILTLNQKNKLATYYDTIYAEDEEFRKTIDELQKHYIKEKSYNHNGYPSKYVKQSMMIDHNLLETTQPIYDDVFKNSSLTLTYDVRKPITGNYECNDQSGEIKVQLASNYYFPDLDLHLLCSPTKEWIAANKARVSPLLQKVKNSMKLSGLITKKKTIIDNLSVDYNIRIMDSPESVNKLIDFIKSNGTIGPQIKYCVNGDKPLPLPEYFYAFSNFIESTGVNVEHFVNEILKEDRNEIGIKQHEYYFLKALKQFYTYFNHILEENGEYTYNQLFNLFSSDQSELYSSEGIANELNSMQYLIIDEFQDISPIIVNWIKRVLTLLKKRNKVVSLMAVGDHWQCIYAWRGASPHILEFDFDKTFLTEKPAKEILMNDNFRSTQNIIDVAEKIFNTSAYYTPEQINKKHGIAFKKAEGIIHFKKFINKGESLTENQSKKNKPSFYRNVAEEIYHLNNNFNRITNEKKKIMILAYTRKIGDNIRAALETIYEKSHESKKIPEQISILTIHKAKGLEGDHVFLIGDINFSQKNILRSKIYEIAQFPIAYDQQSENEKRRLVYVAFTRPKQFLYCYINTLQQKRGSSNDIGLVEKNFADKFKKVYLS